MIGKQSGLNHTGTQTIETERLILRRYEHSDAEDMLRNWVTDSEVTRFWGWEPHRDIDETRAVLAGWIEDYSKSDTYHWVIVLKSDAQAIGYIYLNEINDADGSASVHYLLSRSFWNQGIMTEACRGVLGFAFSVLGAKKICSRHHIANPSSGRVMQKCGMRYLGTEYRAFPECERISEDYCFYEKLC